MKLMEAPVKEADKVRSLNVVMATRRRPSALGGVERVVTSLLGAVGHMRPTWQVDTVSAFRQDTRIDRMPGLSDLIASLRLGWQLRASRADVIFLHCPECFWGIRLLRRRCRPQPVIIAVWHGAGPRRFLVLRKPGHPLAYALAWLRTIQEVWALSANGHVAVHESVASDLRSVYGLDKAVTVVGNAVDAKILDQLSESHSDAGDSSLTALWLGQTGYGKGLDVALSAAAEARQSFPGLRLVVAGVPTGGSIDGVEWRGRVSPAQVTDLYRVADLLVFPSRYEAFPLVVIEAMAAGLPVLVSNGVPPGIVEDGRNGVVITGYDPSHYAAALMRLADPQVRAAMSKANVEDVRRFDANSMAANYVAVAEAFTGTQ